MFLFLLLFLLLKWSDYAFFTGFLSTYSSVKIVFEAFGLGCVGQPWFCPFNCAQYRSHDTSARLQVFGSCSVLFCFVCVWGRYCICLTNWSGYHGQLAVKHKPCLNNRTKTQLPFSAVWGLLTRSLSCVAQGKHSFCFVFPRLVPHACSRYNITIFTKWICES